MIIASDDHGLDGCKVFMPRPSTLAWTDSLVGILPQQHMILLFRAPLAICILLPVFLRLTCILDRLAGWPSRSRYGLPSKCCVLPKRGESV